LQRTSSVVPTDPELPAFTLEGHGDHVDPVAALPDNRRCVSGCDDKLVRVWDIHTRSQLAVLEGHTGWVRSIAVFDGGRYVASGSFDQTVRIWDLESLVEVARLHTDSMVTALAANLHSRRITVAEMTGRVHFFEFET
jgi:WD40 repeat protein